MNKTKRCFLFIIFFSFSEENHHQHKFNLEKEIFVSSLVTYTPGITDFVSFKTVLTQSCRKKSEQPAAKLTNLRTGEKSPFLEIDDFVMKIIAPGFIRKWNYIQVEFGTFNSFTQELIEIKSKSKYIALLKLKSN